LIFKKKDLDLSKLEEALELAGGCLYGINGKNRLK
jgi:hypothetical protein